MRSVRPEDLTTRARIRDAAIELFGRDGFAATSVRSIADRAEVSPALVIHHFGSKELLRAHCDVVVVEAFLGKKDELIGEGASSAMQSWLADIDQFGPFIDYLARMLTDDLPAGDHLFDALLAATDRMLQEQVAAGVVRPPLDRQVLATYVTLYGIVPLMMRRQVARALGGDQLTPRDDPQVDSADPRSLHPWALHGLAIARRRPRCPAAHGRAEFGQRRERPESGSGSTRPVAGFTFLTMFTRRKEHGR